jgi:hypothetical protein
MSYCLPEFMNVVEARKLCNLRKSADFEYGLLDCFTALILTQALNCQFDQQKKERVLIMR